MAVAGGMLWVAVLLHAARTCSGQLTPSPPSPPPPISASAETSTASSPPGAGGGGKSTCHNHPLDRGTPPPLLDKQFELTVEATIQQKEYTLMMELHYDYLSNEAALSISQNGSQSRWLYNFPDYEGYYIEDSTCKTENLRTHPGFQLITYVETDKGGHVSNVSDLFNFGTKYNETFVSTNQTVRGMPVNQWTSCVERQGRTFRLDYYFTKPSYPTPSGSKPIPVRAILTGLPKSQEQNTKDQSLVHIYDFVTYRPGPCQDRSVFRVPHGVVCKRKQNKGNQPTLPDQFSMGVEVIQPRHNLVTFSQQYFDYVANLTRTDITPSRKAMSQFADDYGFRPLKVIHDYSTGIQYVIDVAEENCTMTAIPQNSVDALSPTNDPAHVHMRHGKDMFWLNKHDLRFQGKRSEMGGLVDEQGDLEKKVLVQIWLHASDKTNNYTNDYISNMYNCHDEKPDLQLFNIGSCFTDDEKQMDIIFRVPGTIETVVRGQPRHLQVAVRDAVSKAAQITPIRVNSFYFGQTSPDHVDVWMTIYEAPDIKGNVDHPVPQVSLQTAFGNLKAVIDGDDGLQIKMVSETGSKMLRAEKGSLTTDKDMEDPRLPFLYCNDKTCTKKTGPSSGSMAALGITMLILGVVLGVAGGAFLWKRGPLIPYQVQH